MRYQTRGRIRAPLLMSNVFRQHLFQRSSIYRSPTMVVADSVIEQFFCEPGINEGSDDDPYTVTAPEVMIDYSRSKK